MTYSARSRAAAASVAAAAALLALSPVLLAPLAAHGAATLRAQQPVPPVPQPVQPQPLLLPADTATLSATSPTPPSGLTVQMTQEIYVAAFRASARRWCEAAGPNAGDEPMRSAAASTRLVAHGGVIEREQAGVEQAVDSAYRDLVRGGGCAALATRPTAVVVVDRFEGHPWNAPKSEIAPKDAGESRESGVTVVSRDVKLGHRRFHRIGAQADFTFTTQRQQLVRGRYRVPATKENFADRWREVQALVAADYPTLRVYAAQPAPPAPGAAAAYAARSGYAAWAAAFNNPDTQALEVRMYALPSTSGRDEAYTIVVDYLGYAGR